MNYRVVVYILVYIVVFCTIYSSAVYTVLYILQYSIYCTGCDYVRRVPLCVPVLSVPVKN